mmetsp:Transcript_37004/g.102860  ORF Transcript_37004/g.102860 Transcript_37004/m.102860 type:complete len:343 (-) Transcript_37004:863-1891(-)
MWSSADNSSPPVTSSVRMYVLAAFSNVFTSSRMKGWSSSASSAHSRATILIAWPCCLRTRLSAYWRGTCLCSTSRTEPNPPVPMTRTCLRSDKATSVSRSSKRSISSCRALPVTNWSKTFPSTRQSNASSLRTRTVVRRGPWRSKASMPTLPFLLMVLACLPPAVSSSSPCSTTQHSAAASPFSKSKSAFASRAGRRAWTRPSTWSRARCWKAGTLPAKSAALMHATASSSTASSSTVPSAGAAAAPCSTLASCLGSSVATCAPPVAARSTGAFPASATSEQLSCSCPGRCSDGSASTSRAPMASATPESAAPAPTPSTVPAKTSSSPPPPAAESWMRSPGA